MAHCCRTRVCLVFSLLSIVSLCIRKLKKVVPDEIAYDHNNVTKAQWEMISVMYKTDRRVVNIRDTVWMQLHEHDMACKRCYCLHCDVYRLNLLHRLLLVSNWGSVECSCCTCVYHRSQQHSCDRNRRSSGYPIETTMNILNSLLFGCSLFT